MAYWADVQLQLNNAKAENLRRGQYLAAQVGFYNGQPYAEPDPSMFGYQAELMQRLSWVYTAVNSVAQTLASLANFQVMRLDGEDQTEVTNHPFEQLLRNPNPYQFDSRFDFFEALAGYLTLSGNAYIFANALSPDQPPAELWLLRPDRVYVVPDAVKLVGGYFYQVEGRTVWFDADEVVHIKQFHPRNDWYGLSAIESLALAAEADFKQAEWNRNFFAVDNAKPQGALQYADMIADSDWQKIKADVKTEHGGTQRRMMMLRGAGKGGVQYLQMGISQKDMEFLSGRQFNKEEIWSTLAPGLISMLDKNSTEANSIAGERTFREYAIWTRMQRIAEKFVAKLLPRYGENLVGEFEDIRHRDRNLELEEQKAYALTHTIDEIRQEYYGDDPIGDERGTLLPAEVAPAARSDTALLNGGAAPPPVQASAPDANPDTAGNAANAQDTATANDGTAAKSANQTGVMIALAVPLGAAARLFAAAQDALGADAEITPPNEMHLTLAYLGDASASNVAKETLAALVRVFASDAGMLNGIINGSGQFNTEDANGRRAVYASFDSPDLPTFRHELVELLDAAGVAMDQMHGFTPHITLGYAESDVTASVPTIQVTFDSIVLAWGGEWQPYALEGGAPVLPPPENAAGDATKRAFVHALAAWERKAVERLSKNGKIGNGARFEHAAIAPALAAAIGGALENAADAGAVKSVFANAREWAGYP